MKTLITKTLHALWTDELAARRWIRGGLLWAGAVGTQLVSAGAEAAEQWTLRQWAVRLLVAGIVGAAGMVTAGERNPKPQCTP